MVLNIGLFEFLVIAVIVLFIIVPAVAVPFLTAKRGNQQKAKPSRSRRAVSPSRAQRKQEAKLKSLLRDGVLTQAEYENKLRLLRQRNA